jgi:hypothetical protein
MTEFYRRFHKQAKEHLFTNFEDPEMERILDKIDQLKNELRSEGYDMSYEMGES